MILILLILTGVQFATNDLYSVHYALEHTKHVVNISPQAAIVQDNGGDVITNCFDVTANVMLSSNQCFGTPPTGNFTILCNLDSRTSDVEVWHHVGPLDGKPFFQEFHIYMILSTNFFVLPATNGEEYFVLRATCPWDISDWSTN